VKFHEYASNLLPKTSEGFKMRKMISAISNFLQTVIMISVLSSGICLVAGEIRLAALKKGLKGSSKLSVFTQRMNKTKGY
jgi:hypothetical protein